MEIKFTFGSDLFNPKLLIKILNKILVSDFTSIDDTKFSTRYFNDEVKVIEISRSNYDRELITFDFCYNNIFSINQIKDLLFKIKNKCYDSFKKLEYEGTTYHINSNSLKLPSRVVCIKKLKYSGVFAEYVKKGDECSLESCNGNYYVCTITPSDKYDTEENVCDVDSNIFKQYFKFKEV